MSTADMNYCEYFNVDEKYFPCIDEAAIKKGVPWDTTYPHETFIELLNKTEKMLSGTSNRSIWIHGAYGTGKSQCAYTLKKLLEVSENEVRAYWEKFESLKKQLALLEKLIGHKTQGIVTAYRYASGSINTPHQLFFAVQESIKKALAENHIAYKGGIALRESVIRKLEDPSVKRFVDDQLDKPEWSSTFSQSSADEIIAALKKGGEISSLMDNILSLDAKGVVKLFDLSADSLHDWIADIIDKNKIKIVFIWDEFSDYFRQNSTSLSEFQKIVSLCQEMSFYFIIVTHPLSSLDKVYGSGNTTSSWQVVQQRFDKVEISLPDNIAFDLIGHAFSIKPAAKEKWTLTTTDLTAYVPNSTKAVMQAANITNENTLQGILPLHPLAALALKNIASTFQSNQRSIFDFIKTPKDMNVQAFQWFIQNTSPYSDRHFLTVDMLWDFFYEKGKDYLSDSIRVILDTFHQQTQLTAKEEYVLKTILIMQSLAQKMNAERLPNSLMQPTDQNLSYAFEGDDRELEETCKSIAKALVNKGILIENPIGKGKKVYAAAILAGDSVKIEETKKKLREHTTIANLVGAGADVATALGLSTALKLRYAENMDNGGLPIVTISDFKKKMDALKENDMDWHCCAVLALAKTDVEAQRFRSLIQNIIADPAYKNITVIDALSTPLGEEAFEQYVDYVAMKEYYNGNNGAQAKENEDKAKNVLERDWKNRIQNGHFIVFTYANQEGEKANGADDVKSILQKIVLMRFPHVQDFTKGLSESQLKRANSSQKIVLYGMNLENIKVAGLIAGCEQKVLGKFWGKNEYWQDESLASEHIIVIKKAIDSMIATAFKSSGKISIDEIYDCLANEFGFSPCNLSAFITGFLLKEYSKETYRYMDEKGHRGTMTPDQLSKMISNYIGKKTQTTYIVSLTSEEKAFYELTEKAWNIPANTCSSPQQAGTRVLAKMRDLSYPVWCLEKVTAAGVFYLVQLYIKLIQSEGDAAHDVANEIGRISLQQKASAQELQKLLTLENCKNGMHLFLQSFENNNLLNLAEDIGAKDTVMEDIKNLFSVQYAALWNRSTGEDEIRKLIAEYEVAKYTNAILNVTAHSKEDAFEKWREKLKFIGFSCEAFNAKSPILEQFFSYLLKIAKKKDMLPEQIRLFSKELKDNVKCIKEIIDNPLMVFKNMYAPYLEDFNNSECEKIKNSIPVEMFILPSIQSNEEVKKAAENYKKGQLKSQLYKLWSDKTGGCKDPRTWSERYCTPILCCIEEDEYTEAKKAFDTLNSSTPSEANIKAALEYLQKTDSFTKLASAAYRDQCFARYIIGDYASLLADLNKVRESLKNTGISAYEWNDNPNIKSTIANMAAAEYNAGGSDKVVNIIKGMKDDELKKWLADVVKKDMVLGIKIIINREE